MQLIYLLPLLLLSSVHHVSSELDSIRIYKINQDDNKRIGYHATEGDAVQDGVNADTMDHDFDDEKVPQDMSARISVKPQGALSETYGGFKNMSESNIVTHSSHLIVERSTGKCKFPTNLKESEIDCTIYPSKVVCIQSCMFGYTLEGKDGIKRRMECNNEENRWKPVPEFEKCKPFVDCGVTIGPGGSYKCRKNYMHKGSDCDIACSAYEDKEAVPTAKYECDINGKWTPQLPFCATGGSGLKLVPVPHGAKQHSNLK